MVNIMNHVDILDLVSIEVNVNKHGHLFVDFISLDANKRVIIDEGAMSVIQEFLIDKTLGKSKNDKNVLGYVKEYVGKMLSELYRNGLVELEKIPDAPDDPYKNLRKMDRRLD